VADALAWIGWSLTLLGALACIVGAIGVLRFPDFYTRIHAASVTDTAGASLMLFGMVLLSDTWMTGVKLGIVWVLVMVTSPAAAHALANAARSSGLKPQLSGFRFERGERRSGP
jgi:multicomponent Na+:H+ antiporter subunit G